MSKTDAVDEMMPCFVLCGWIALFRPTFTLTLNANPDIREQVLSPWFIFGSPVGRAALRAAKEGRLPPDVKLKDIGDFLVSLHSSGGNMLGVLHSMGACAALPCPAPPPHAVFTVQHSIFEPSRQECLFPPSAALQYRPAGHNAGRNAPVDCASPLYPGLGLG